jgi:ATP-binding cassette subfamily B protein
MTHQVIGGYVTFTLLVTEWRNKFRREQNELNNQANNIAVDSLLNFETVKYFSNEEHEAARYNGSLRSYVEAAVKSQTSLALLNIGQSGIIAVGLAGVMLLAAYKVVNEEMTIGDLVLVNTYLIQLYIPLNFLGTSYRMIKSSLVRFIWFFGRTSVLFFLSSI